MLDPRSILTEIICCSSDGTTEPLMWADVTDPEAQDKPSTAKDPKSGTALSIFHDTKRYWLIYQNVDGKLVAQNEKDQLGTFNAKPIRPSQSKLK